MTQREGKAAAAPRAVTAQQGGRGADAAHAPADPLTAWDSLCSNMSADERRDLLGLARRQGLLYGHQLPHQNGAKPAATETRWNRILAELLQGKPVEVPRPPAPTFIDAELDATQRDAVAKALSATDICLIAGLPGTGKSRVVTEIVLQATGRGERVLLLAPRGAAVDRVLENIIPHEAVLPLRLRDAGEPVSASAVRFTFAERVRTLREETLANALKAKTHAEDRCRSHSLTKGCWPELRSLAAEYESVVERIDAAAASADGELAAIRTRHDAWRVTPPADATDALAKEYLRTLNEFEAAEAAVYARQSDNAKLRQQAADELSASAGQATRLQTIVDARRSGRWWSVQWWQALFSGTAGPQLAELQSRRQHLVQQLADLQRRAADLDAEKQDIKARQAQAVAKLESSALQSKQAELAAVRQQLEADAKALRERWEQIVCRIEPESCRPTSCSSNSIEPAFTKWQQQLNSDEQACQFANQWASFLHDTSDNLCAKLIELSNLLAGTVKGFESDRQAVGKRFDLLIIEEAHELGEDTFRRVAAHAERCVLVGEPAWHYDAHGKARRGGKSGLGFMESLWRSLHCGPVAWPYSWIGDAHRLTCRLREVPADQRRWIETEQLADFPEIELRILARPDADPALAEVVFPPAISIAQAKQLIFQELQELPVNADGVQIRWLENADSVSLVLSDSTPATEIAIELQPGVREIVYRGKGGRDEVRWQTHRLEFARHANWDREQAQAWASRHLPCAENTRTCLLQIPHRMAPSLAEFLSDTVFAGGYELSRAAAANAAACGVYFVPVPALRQAERGVDLPRAGAGLELDLTTARCTDRLPPDLRTNLPARGFVNYPEARSVVRKLEELIDQAAPAEFAVVALYAGQVELIRGLLRKSERLKDSRIEVGLPGEFTEREFTTVLLSLTRSHSHRAVTFAEEFSQLAQAMTRARSRLYMFGDAGTLVHRSRSTEANGRAEQQAISMLVQYLQGLGKHAQAFQLCGSDS